MKQEQQPTYSQRTIENDGVNYLIYACVTAKVKTTPMVVAETLQLLGIPVKITEVGKNIDGVDQPDYLGAFSEIWVSEQGMEIVERMKGLERYQKSLVDGEVGWIGAKVKRFALKVGAGSKSEVLAVT